MRSSDSVLSYIFGGYCEAMKPNEFNKLYRFDIRTHASPPCALFTYARAATKTWTAVQTKGAAPEGRSRCSMVAAQDCLYILGGWNRTHSFSDLFQFDIGTRPPAVRHAADRTSVCSQQHVEPHQAARRAPDRGRHPAPLLYSVPQLPAHLRRHRERPPERAAVRNSHINSVRGCR